MTLDEFQKLQIGDAVLVHDVRDFRLRPGVVVSEGHFRVGRPELHAGIRLLGSRAVIHPTWQRVHRHPLNRAEACSLCRLAPVNEGEGTHGRS
jgi:hypothetical protein